MGNLTCISIAIALTATWYGGGESYGGGASPVRFGSGRPPRGRGGPGGGGTPPPPPPREEDEKENMSEEKSEELDCF